MLPSANRLQLSLITTFVLLLTFALPITAQAQSNLPVKQSLGQGSRNATIQSTTGWQSTGFTVQQGAQYTIAYISGTWTVDVNKWPYVGPQGYLWDEDQKIYQGCKYDSTLTYATLLGEIGNGSDFAIGKGGVFTASASGNLSMRINDLDACLGDNSGSIKLTFIDAASGMNINVDGTQPWTDTGIDISSGTSINIRASGIVWMAAGPAVPYNPDGNSSCIAGQGSPGPGLYCYSLIGMIGNGTPFQLGSSSGFKASNSGRLYLGVNDNVFSDNSGSWQANIIIHVLKANHSYAGYAATGTQNNTIAYSDVTATWTIPTVSCAPLENSQSATWVGLGDGSTDLEQVGTESNCLDGLQQILAVWQVYINGQTQGVQLLCIACVSAGDKVKAEAQFLSLGQFQFTLWDLSSNKQWSQLASGDNSSKATALGQCIVEEPQGQILSHFSQVTITCQANPNNTSDLPIGVAGDTIQRWVMPQAKTGYLNANGTGAIFSVTWVHA